VKRVRSLTGRLTKISLAMAGSFSAGFDRRTNGRVLILHPVQLFLGASPTEPKAAVIARSASDEAIQFLVITRETFPGCCAAHQRCAADPGSIRQVGPGSAEQREERCTASGTRDQIYFVSAGSRCTGSTHSTVSGFSTGSMSRLIATAWPSLRTSTHSRISSRLALIS
jgi:hypothetical protein